MTAPIDLDALEQLAKARSREDQFRMSWASTVSACFHAAEDTMAYAAALDPDVILALIASAREAARLRERVAELREDREHWRATAERLEADNAFLRGALTAEERERDARVEQLAEAAGVIGGPNVWTNLLNHVADIREWAAVNIQAEGAELRGEERGRVEERAAVVAWLRSDDSANEECAYNCLEQDLDRAERIERGEHIDGDGGEKSP